MQPWIFTEEHATGFARTIAPMIWGFLVTRIPAVMTFAEQLGLNELIMSGILGMIIYSAIRWTAERVPWVGYLLIINKKPHYAGVTETPAVPPQE
jgi:hypothetical protein